MNEKIKNNIISILILASGVYLALIPFNLSKVCDKLTKYGTPMKCYYSGLVFIFSGITIAILSLLAVYLNKRKISVLTALLSMAIAFFAYISSMGIIKVGNMKTLKWQVGFCKSASMDCVSITQPAIKTLLPLIVFLGLLSIMKTFLTKE